MNPFGLQLRYYRKERGIPLKALAAEIHLSVKTLSAVETGRRGPLTGNELKAVCRLLELDQREVAALEEAALDSLPQIRIPYQATPREYRALHCLARSIGTLSGAQLTGILALLNPKQVMEYQEVAK